MELNSHLGHTLEVQLTPVQTCGRHTDFYDCLYEYPTVCEWDCAAKMCIPLGPECGTHTCEYPCITDPNNDCHWDTVTGTCNLDARPHPENCSGHTHYYDCIGDTTRYCEWDCPT